MELNQQRLPRIQMAVPLFVQLSVSHWQLISAPSHWHVIPQRQRNQGRWKEAEELEVQVMETFKRVLGSEYPAPVISPSPVLHPAAE